MGGAWPGRGSQHSRRLSLPSQFYCQPFQSHPKEKLAGAGKSLLSPPTPRVTPLFPQGESRLEALTIYVTSVASKNSMTSFSVIFVFPFIVLTISSKNKSIEIEKR